MRSKIRVIFDETMDMIVISFFTIMPLILIAIFLYGVFCLFSPPACAEYIGRLSQNPFYADSCANQFSPCANPFYPNSPRNQFGPYGNYFSPYSTGPFGNGLRVYGDAAPDPAGEGTVTDNVGSYDDYAAEGGYE